jgi:hypothetical protein
VETEAFFDVPIQYAHLDTSKAYPALSFLLEQYYHLIKGKVMIPSLSESVCDGAVMAGVTAAAHLDALPVSVMIDHYLKKEGFIFEVIENTTDFITNIEAFKWAKANYLTKETTRLYLGQHSFTAFGGKESDQFPNLYDYFVATKAFVFCLNSNVEEEREVLSQFLESNEYPLATPVLGLPVDEGAGLKEIEKNGHYFIIANVQNLSCTSAFPSELSRLTPQPAPMAHQIVPGSVFIAFYVTDGDSMGFSTVFHYDDIKNDTFSHEVPIGWSVNPLLFDVYPSLIYWKWKYAPEQYEMVLDWHDQTQNGILRKYNHTAWGLYCKQIRDYLEPLYFYTTNYFEGHQDFIHKTNPYYQINGYQGDKGSVSHFAMVNKSVTSTITGRTQQKSIDDIVQDIVTALDNMPIYEPAFLLVAIGDGRSAYGGGEVNRKARLVKDRLLAFTVLRSFHFLKPKDLAATWKAWKEY